MLREHLDIVAAQDAEWHAACYKYAFAEGVINNDERID
jgi:hypothetical protein